jgi:RecB family exonuclease
LAVENKLQVIKNQEEEEKFLFFWLALIRYYIYTEKQNKMNDFLMLMEEIQDDILPYGIVLEGVDSSDPIEIRYKTVQK